MFKGDIDKRLGLDFNSTKFASGVRGQFLTRVFEELKDYGDRRRWEEALEACRRKELI